MAASGRLAMLALAVLVATAVADNHENPYIDARDSEVAKLASEAAMDYCAGTQGFDAAEIQKDGRKTLETAMGGENILLKVLTRAGSPDDVGTELRSEITPAWVLGRTMPIVVAIGALVVYLFCCWTACPCCKCCRCGSKERTTSVYMKGCLFLLMVLVFVLIIVAALMTMSGYNKCSDGFEGSACVAATMLNATMSGSASPPFIGMMPVLEAFDNLDSQLDDGSQLLTDLDQIMASTAQIEDAVKVTTETLSLLSAMMALSGNVRPQSALGENLMHTCEFCEAVSPLVAGASDALSSGVAVALNAARKEVKTQLSTEKRADLQQTLRKSTEPLVEFKKTIRNVFAVFVEPGQFDAVKGQIDTTVLLSVNLFLACAVLLLCFALCACGSFLGREKFRRGEDMAYSRVPHRLACCTWCCSFLFIIPVFVLGGLLTTVTAPLGGVCLIMDDFDSKMLGDISGGIGMNVTGDSGLVLKGMVDKCLAGVDGGNPNLLDIIFTRNSSGAKVTLRDQIVSSVRDPIDQSFDQIESTMANSSSSSLGNSTLIADLRNIFANNPMDAMIIADASQMTSDSTLQKLAQDSRLTVGYMTSCACANFTVMGSLGDLEGNSVPGITNFVEKLRGLATAYVPSASCLKSVVCDPTLAAAQAEACSAGNSYVDLKRKIVEAPTDLFRCDIFQKADGSDCDPLNMAQDGSGAWQNDCLLTENGEKVMRRKEKTCTLQEFTTYVQNFDGRIQKTFDRMDTASVAVLSGITTDLKSLVDRYIVNVITNIADGLTCGLMAATWQGLVNGLCYQGIAGIYIIGNSYVMFGWAIVVLGIVMYGLWRRSIDNVNADIAKTKDVYDPAAPYAEA